MLLQGPAGPGARPGVGRQGADVLSMHWKAEPPAFVGRVQDLGVDSQSHGKSLESQEQRSHTTCPFP